MKRAQAVAYANIALAKYWGKADIENNLPAVPSLSLTLNGLSTKTSVSFDQALEEDVALLNGNPASGRPLERIIELLDRVRTLSGFRDRARVESENDFPTAAGLASSASGFAALALAACRAADLDFSPRQVSGLARRSSASAARSLWGGYVELPAFGEFAEPIMKAEHFPLFMLVVVTAQGVKKIGSTEGMKRTASTSPFYKAWLDSAPKIFEEIKQAILLRDIEQLGPAVEQSSLAMHASMLAARPAIRYFAPETISVLNRVLELQQSGLHAYATMDAGPHVKVLTVPEHVDQVEAALREAPGASSVRRCASGQDARIIQ